MMSAEPMRPKLTHRPWVSAKRPVLLRHVAEIDYGTGKETMRFRVNGKPAVQFRAPIASQVRPWVLMRNKKDEVAIALVPGRAPAARAERHGHLVGTSFCNSVLRYGACKIAECVLFGAVYTISIIF